MEGGKRVAVRTVRRLSSLWAVNCLRLREGQDLELDVLAVEFRLVSDLQLEDSGQGNPYNYRSVGDSPGQHDHRMAIGNEFM